MSAPGEFTHWRLLVVFNLIVTERVIYEIIKIELSVHHDAKVYGWEEN